MRSDALLIVEDDILIAGSLREVLELEGYAVVVANTGATAVTALQAAECRIACLITDIRCGAGPNGWELAAFARSASPTLPVMYITGDSAGEYDRNAVPASVMLQKPFSLARFMRALSALLHESDAAEAA